MNLSFKTLFISIVLSAPFILLLHILMKKISDKSFISARVLNLISLLIFFRILLPFEYPYTLTIYSKVIFPFVRDLFLTEIPLFNMSGMEFLCIIWALGSFYKFIRLIREYLTLKKLLTYNFSDDHFMNLMPLAYQQHNVRVLESIKSPCVVGIIKPTIILPNTFFTEKELEYIFQHEYLHISRMDLLLKGIYELLVIIYWWNPLMYIFRQQFSTTIELGVDEALVKNFSKSERIDYIQLMLKVQNEQNYSDKESEFALYFTSAPAEPLLQRASNVLNKHKVYPSVPAMIGLFIVGFYLSTSIIIEPYYANRPDTEGTFTINEENAYFLVSPDNGYELYVDGQFIQSFQNIKDETFLALPQYTSKEEIND